MERAREQGRAADRSIANDGGGARNAIADADCGRAGAGDVAARLNRKCAGAKLPDVEIGRTTDEATRADG